MPHYTNTTAPASLHKHYSSCLHLHTNTYNSCLITPNTYSSCLITQKKNTTTPACLITQNTTAPAPHYTKHHTAPASLHKNYSISAAPALNALPATGTHSAPPLPWPIPMSPHDRPSCDSVLLSGRLVPRHTLICCPAAAWVPRTGGLSPVGRNGVLRSQIFKELLLSNQRFYRHLTLSSFYSLYSFYSD